MYSDQFLIKDQSRGSEQPACLDCNPLKHIKQHLQDALITLEGSLGHWAENTNFGRIQWLYKKRFLHQLLLQQLH